MSDRIFLLLKGVLLVSFSALGSSHSSSKGSGTHHVKAHTTKKGSHVKSHDQTNPNSTQRDNWSAKGNVNSETGQPGTKPVSH